jgi:hypothetical protein
MKYTESNLYLHLCSKIFVSLNNFVYMAIYKCMQRSKVVCLGEIPICDKRTRVMKDAKS